MEGLKKWGDVKGAVGTSRIRVTAVEQNVRVYIEDADAVRVERNKEERKIKR